MENARSPVLPVETSQWKFVFQLQVSGLYHQFHTFRGLLSGLASHGSLEWNLRQKFPKKIFRNFLLMENAHYINQYLETLLVFVRFVVRETKTLISHTSKYCCVTRTSLLHLA